jgi:hypothetical protein
MEDLTRLLVAAQDGDRGALEAAVRAGRADLRVAMAAETA